LSIAGSALRNAPPWISVPFFPASFSFPIFFKPPPPLFLSYPSVGHCSHGECAFPSPKVSCLFLASLFSPGLSSSIQNLEMYPASIGSAFSPRLISEGRTVSPQPLSLPGLFRAKSQHTGVFFFYPVSSSPIVFSYP